MKVTVEEVFREDELIRRLRRVPLLKQPDVLPYQDARISMVDVPTELLHPPSYYVLQENLVRLAELRHALLEERRTANRIGGDILRLWGGIRYRVEGEAESRVIVPPIVELQWDAFTVEACMVPVRVALQLPIIADGMHRAWMARSLKRPLRVVLVERPLVEGVDPHPYYACASNWGRVRVLDKVPEKKEDRKLFRTADPYALYRDFSVLGSTGPRHSE